MTLTNDLTNLTSIPEKFFEKLDDNIIFSISQTVEEMLTKNETSCEIESGIGTLIISFETGELKFKFIPSKRLEKEVIKTIETGKNSMENVLTSNMVSTLEKTYKELL